MTSRLQHKLMSQEVLVGMQSFTGCAALVEIMGSRGFDWVSIDMEHSPTSWESVEHAVRAADISGILPFVRVAENSAREIMHALDVGAAGVIVPHVNSVDEAVQAVRAAAYPPQGDRGVCTGVRASGYMKIPPREYVAQANASVSVIPLVEGREGVEAFDDLLEVEGIDLLWIGIADLAASYGLPAGSTFEDPELSKIAREVNGKAARKGKALMAPVAPPLTREYADVLRGLGFRALSWGTDVNVFARACEVGMSGCRSNEEVGSQERRAVGQ